MRFVQGHALVNVFFHSRRVDDLNIYLDIVSMAILGVVGEADPPPVKFTPAFWHGCHLPIIVCFTIFISTAWVFSCAVLSDVYDLDIHLRAPSVLEVPIIFSVRSFRRRL